MTSNLPTTETKWDAQVIRSRVKATKKQWGEVWTHASPDMRTALISEVAFGFLTCREDVEMTGQDVIDLLAAIRESAGLE